MESIVSLLSMIPLWGLLIISASGVIFGDFAAKSWSISQSPAWFWLSLAAYAVSALFFLPTLLKEGLVYTSIIWVVLSTIGFLFIGLYVFKETLTTAQYFGIAFGVLSIVILSIAD